MFIILDTICFLFISFLIALEKYLFLRKIGIVKTFSLKMSALLNVQFFSSSISEENKMLEHRLCWALGYLKHFSGCVSLKEYQILSV